MSARRLVARSFLPAARIATLALGGALTLSVAGCARVPTRTGAPPVRNEAPLLTSETQPADWPAPQWWRRYGDAQLDGWVERALREAPTLAAARARVTAAQAAFDVTRASRQLQVTAEAQQQRQRLSDNGLLPPRFLGFNWYSTSDLGLDARYDLDLGGGALAGQRAAAARAAAAQAEQAAAELGLASAIVIQYFGWQAEAMGLQLARSRLDAVDAELQLLRLRQGAELARADESLQLEQARQQVQEALGGYDTRMQLRRVALGALLGVSPDTLPAPPTGDLPVPGTGLPASAHIDLMARRADLIAARGRIAAASADLDTARAGFVPDLSLHALLGLSSRDLGKLLDAGSAAPLFSAAVHLPLFDAGRLRAQYAGSEASLRAAVADYDERLLNAAGDVNGALTERAGSVIRLDLRNRQIDTTAKLRSLVEERTRAGLTDARAQWAATRSWLEAREARVPVQYDLLSADLKLIRALGGGYGGSDGTGEQRRQ